MAMVLSETKTPLIKCKYVVIGYTVASCCFPYSQLLFSSGLVFLVAVSSRLLNHYHGDTNSIHC